jgi:hypothetical protein
MVSRETTHNPQPSSSKIKIKPITKIINQKIEINGTEKEKNR